jgi:hypothetical protein
LRLLAIGLLAFFVVASLMHQSAMANEYRCFDDENVWCAWTVRESAPEMGWGAISKSRLESLVIETVIDSRNNNAALRVHVSPITPQEQVAVNLSVRENPDEWQDWRSFSATMLGIEDGRAHFVLDRSALVAMLEASDNAHLYVFIELDNGSNSYRVSRKISLDSLDAALSFARTGR